jgi:uncharacterized protein CbrC (UPF0167 family)
MALLDSSVLPRFPYHRDPVASGSMKESNAVCDCCGKARGVVYAGVTYARAKPKGLCPWCIADGSAADKFDAQFFDAEFVEYVGDKRVRIELPKYLYRAVFGCTIGFATYNPIDWWVHCGEPAEYVTRNEPYEMIFECRRCGLRQPIYDCD